MTIKVTGEEMLGRVILAFDWSMSDALCSYWLLDAGALEWPDIDTRPGRESPDTGDWWQRITLCPEPETINIPDDTMPPLASSQYTSTLLWDSSDLVMAGLSTNSSQSILVSQEDYLILILVYLALWQNNPSDMGKLKLKSWKC